MNYILIFICKILEDSLATLRLIVVSNGKKILGAILQFIVTVIWVILTGWVLTDFMKDIFKIISFSLGALVGSYLGCIIEEKIALGMNSFIVKINENKIKSLKEILNDKKVNYLDIKYDTLLITSTRKKGKAIIKYIKSIDNNAIIICEKIKLFS